MPDMTDDRLAEIEARAEAATPGPWHWGKYGLRVKTEPYNVGPYVLRDHEDGVREGAIEGPQGKRDTEFIAHARQDIPDLLAEVKRLRARVTDLEGDWLEHENFCLGVEE